MRLTDIARSLIALGLGAALLSAPLAAAAQPADTIIDYTAQDRAMNAAVAEAKRTLPEFWRMHAEVGPDNASLKIAFPTPGGGAEHMWLGDIRREGGVVTGVLRNDPRDVDLRKGQTLTIDLSRVSDWSIQKNNRLWGNYTTRVMLNQMMAKDADYFRQVLSDTPTER